MFFSALIMYKLPNFHGSTTVHPQMWRKQKRMQARSCWTWRSRRSSGRVNWRTWRKIWGRRRPKAKWRTQNCSILLVTPACKAELHILYISIRMRPCYPASAFLTSSQIPAARTWEAEKSRAGPADSPARGGRGHHRDHSLSNVRLRLWPPTSFTQCGCAWK